MRLLTTIFHRTIVPARALPASPFLILAATIASVCVHSAPSWAAPLSAPWTASGTLAQDSGNSEDDEVPPKDVEKYVAIYQAMQHDHTLTAEQAASRNGMTLEAFRQLENRVQRDDAAMEHVRDELKAAAAHASPAASPSGADSGK
jgi:hypothetical protein